MMSMNGFTLGFFFPKQDFVLPARDDTPSDSRGAPAKTLVTSICADDAADRPAPLSLYAYRFF